MRTASGGSKHLCSSYSRADSSQGIITEHLCSSISHLSTQQPITATSANHCWSQHFANAGHGVQLHSAAGLCPLGRLHCYLHSHPQQEPDAWTGRTTMHAHTAQPCNCCTLRCNHAISCQPSAVQAIEGVLPVSLVGCWSCIGSWLGWQPCTQHSQPLRFCRARWVPLLITEVAEAVQPRATPKDLIHVGPQVARLCPSPEGAMPLCCRSLRWLAQ